MKKLFIIYIFMFAPLSVFTQNQEISLYYRYGLPDTKYKFPIIDRYSRLGYLFLQTHNDKGLVFNHKFFFWKKAGLATTVSLDYSRSIHYLPIIGVRYGYTLENVKLLKQRMGIGVGICEQLKLKKDNSILLDFGFGIYYKLYKENYKNYSSNYKYNNEDWIEYKYNINTYHLSYKPTSKSKVFTLPTEWINMHLKFKLKNNLYLDLGTDIIFHLQFFYDYTYSVRYHLKKIDPNTGEIINYIGLYNNYGVLGQKPSKQDNFIYTTIGLTYKFDTPIKNPFKNKQ